jgi:hypothetical protein
MWEKVQRASVATPVVPKHVALAAGVGFVLFAVATSAGVPVAVVGGVLVAAALLIGPSAALGGTSGLLLHDLFRGAVSVWTLAAAVWLCLFVTMLAWLTPSVAGGRARASVQRPPRAVRLYIGAVLIAGLYATALAAWVLTVAGSERFYTAAAGLLPGVAVASVLGVVVLVAATRLDRGVAVSPAQVPDRPGRLTAAGLLLVVAAWLGGAIGTDLLAHDLGLFPTEIQLEYYVAGLFGSGSLVATVGKAVLVGVYHYGEAAVLLSAPLAGVLSGLLVGLGRGRIRTPVPDVDLLNGRTDDY